MRYRAIKNFKEAVGAILRDKPETRNSDILLMIEMWREYYPDSIKTGRNGEEGVWLKSLYFLPREDHVKRSRAYWQNVKKLYPPTDKKVAKARRINIDENRVAFGYPTEESAGTGKPSWVPPSEKEDESMRELPFVPVNKYTHICSGECRRSGCNCECGEFHL